MGSAEMSDRRQAGRRQAEDRPLPHNLEAERSVLGVILIHNEVFDHVADLLEAEDFYRVAHRQIFRAMDTLAESSQSLDLVVLKNELDRRGELEAVGGPAYISSLVDGLPHATNAQHYAGIVKEKARLRLAITAATKLETAAYQEEASAAELATETAEQLYDLGGLSMPGKPTFLRDIVTDGMATIEQAYERKGAVTGLATGFRELDLLTAGLHPGDLIILAARTSIGKTALAMNIARVVGATSTVLVFSLEMTKLQLFMRLFAAEAGVDSQRLRTGYLVESDWGRLSQAVVSLGDAHVLIDDTPSIGIREVRARSRQVRSEHGLSLIVVDYIQLMRGRGQFDTRAQEVGAISHGLKSIAKELQIPIIALSQLNRAPEGGPGRKARRPQLSDLRESGDLEQDADVVLFIYRPEKDDDDVAELIIAKQRNGPSGHTVKLTFQKELMRFEAYQEAPPVLTTPVPEQREFYGA